MRLRDGYCSRCGVEGGVLYCIAGQLYSSVCVASEARVDSPAPPAASPLRPSRVACREPRSRTFRRSNAEAGTEFVFFVCRLSSFDFRSETRENAQTREACCVRPFAIARRSDPHILTCPCDLPCVRPATKCLCQFCTGSLCPLSTKKNNPLSIGFRTRS